MQNPILSEDQSIMTCTEWATIALRGKVGDTYLTNVPGTVGHNYAKWEIVKISSEVIDGMIEVVSKRLG